jgi:site-specific recombinase XerD
VATQRVAAGPRGPAWQAASVHPAPSVIDRRDDEDSDKNAASVSVVEEDINDVPEMTTNSGGISDGISAGVATVAVEAPLPPELLVQVAGYAAAARAKTTRLAGGSDWEHFRRWCDERGRHPLPATAETVAAYLSAFAGTLATSTLSRRRTVIRIAHAAAGLDSPTEHPGAREVWSGIRRGHGTAAAAKTALWTADLARLIATLPTTPSTIRDPAEPGVLLGVRDRALLLLGFAGALRRSELSALDIDDVIDDPHGLVVRIGRSKTDQDRTGVVVGVPFGHQPALCPVRAVHAWRTALAATLGLDEDALVGPLFRPATRLSPAAIRLVVQRRCTAAGLDPRRYAAHSLRSGFATQASANGAAERDVMRHGRWRSVAVARGYVQRGNLFTDNAAGRLGL